MPGCNIRAAIPVPAQVRDEHDEGVREEAAAEAGGHGRGGRGQGVLMPHCGQVGVMSGCKYRGYLERKNLQPDGTVKLTSVTNLRKEIVTFMSYSNDMFHYMFKAEFVTLASLKVP